MRIYVLSAQFDDILVASSDIACCTKLRGFLTKVFEIKDLGNATFVLRTKKTEINLGCPWLSQNIQLD